MNPAAYVYTYIYTHTHIHVHIQVIMNRAEFLVAPASRVMCQVSRIFFVMAGASVAACLLRAGVARHVPGQPPHSPVTRDP